MRIRTLQSCFLIVGGAQAYREGVRMEHGCCWRESERRINNKQRGGGEIIALGGRVGAPEALIERRESERKTDLRHNLRECT